MKANPSKANKSELKDYAVVRVRGTANIIKEIEDTFKILKITKPNHCVVIQKNPSYDGMLQVVKDYATWGEISEDMKKKLDTFSKGKKVVRLHPPRKGYGRKGTSLAFRQGGALGYRGEKIKDILERMMQ